jgi:hypothetical protein
LKGESYECILLKPFKKLPNLKSINGPFIETVDVIGKFSVSAKEGIIWTISIRLSLR